MPTSKRRKTGKYASEGEVFKNFIVLILTLAVLVLRIGGVRSRRLRTPSRHKVH